MRLSETMNNMRIESESLESEMILDLEREENAWESLSSPWVYWPFVKGTSIEMRKNEWYLIE